MRSSGRGPSPRGQALAITAVAYLTYLMFASLAVALQRAWSLMKRRHLTTQGAASAGAREAPAD
jgi:hypothetical protein